MGLFDFIKRKTPEEKVKELIKSFISDKIKDVNVVSETNSKIIFTSPEHKLRRTIDIDKAFNLYYEGKELAVLKYLKSVSGNVKPLELRKEEKIILPMIKSRYDSFLVSEENKDIIKEPFMSNFFIVYVANRPEVTVYLTKTDIKKAKTTAAKIKQLALKNLKALPEEELKTNINNMKVFVALKKEDGGMISGSNLFSSLLLDPARLREIIEKLFDQKLNAKLCLTLIDMHSITFLNYNDTETVEKLRYLAAISPTKDIAMPSTPFYLNKNKIE